MPVSINANKVELNTPVMLRVAESANFTAFYEVEMVKRTFDCSLKNVTLEDEIVVLRTDNAEEIRITRHKKIPQLVISGTNHRVTFLEIDDETRQMKKVADEVIALKVAEDEAAERRKQLQAKAAAATRRPSLTAGLPKIEKIKIRTEAAVKRVKTMQHDLEKAKQKLADFDATLTEMGYKLTVTDEGAVIEKIEPDQTEAPEVESPETMPV